MVPSTEPITIKVFTGSGFVEEETHASTVAEYRTEKDLDEGIRISVNSKNVADTKGLADGDYVAAVSNNKTGGAKVGEIDEDILIAIEHDKTARE